MRVTLKWDWKEVACLGRTSVRPFIHPTPCFNFWSFSDKHFCVGARRKKVCRKAKAVPVGQ